MDKLTEIEAIAMLERAMDIKAEIDRLQTEYDAIRKSVGSQFGSNIRTDRFMFCYVKPKRIVDWRRLVDDLSVPESLIERYSKISKETWALKPLESK